MDESKLPEYDLTADAKQVSFRYTTINDDEVTAVDSVSLSINKGEYVAILGRNGSGKSSLAKLFNVLELPSSGKMKVFSLDTDDDECFWTIRSHSGMVFQNPDNQIVGTTVEEDVAFGPENLGVPLPMLKDRVEEALRYVGLEEKAQKQPTELSGGQKQKLAIAGVLAMSPEMLILDESTSMLDPKARDEFLQLIERLRKEKNMTVIHITHDMHEAYLADRIFVLSHGKILLEGSPAHVFSQTETIRNLGLELPKWAELLRKVALLTGETNSLTEDDFLSKDTAEAAIKRILMTAQLPNTEDEECVSTVEERITLRVTELGHHYDHSDKAAIENVNFEARRGEVVAVIGHSGSGKTTLISHLNGIIRPQTGRIEVWDSKSKEYISTESNAQVKAIRKHVGLLFQYPEHQLFEETVEKDISYGPLKMGYSEEETKKLVKEAMALVGLDSNIATRSPFELSGGQKRRVAFAGVLAMDPEILVLDEPAAGLDPKGQREIFGYIESLKQKGKTIILVSHNMDEAAKIADRIVVLCKGKQRFFGTPKELFGGNQVLSDMRLEKPIILRTLDDLRESFPTLDTCVFRIGKAANALIAAAKEVRSKC